jgi:hypothetical protein
VLYFELEKALDRIGINREERLCRRISPHSWQHYLNTTLRMTNVPDSKIREVTGAAIFLPKPIKIFRIFPENYPFG